MRMMWWSNGPWVPSGYGVQTRLFVPRLAAAGHEVAITTNAGLQGGSIVWEGIRVFPGVGSAGTQIVGHHSQSWGAEITLSLFDAWVIDPGQFAATGMRWVPWFPVDSEPVQPSVIGSVKRAAHSIVFSKFGERICLAQGLSPYYVPHGVDTKVYRPTDRREARVALGCPQDKYLIGMVAVNRGSPSRKSLPQVLQAFARFAERHDDAVLYLHTSTGEEPWRESVAMPLTPLLNHLGIAKKVILAESYNMFLGFPDAYMAKLYNAMDVLVAPSMGEGFGVPILEAQACGCPVLVGDWTSMSELCFSGYKIPKEGAEFFWTDLQGGHFLPHVAAILDGMEALYQRRDDVGMRAAARQGAETYDADKVMSEYWLPTLASIEGAIRRNPARNRRAELLLRLLGQAPEGSVAEVGCSRVEVEIPAEGHSTLYLAKACSEARRQFFSFDFDPVAVDVADSVLQRAGLSARATLADGCEGLRAAGPIALLHLDGSDDPSEALAQFAAAEIVPGGLVVIDDAQPAGSNVYGRATAVLQHCRQRGVPFELVATEPGSLAAVLRVHDGKIGLMLP